MTHKAMVTDAMVEAFGQQFWPVNAASKIDGQREEIRAALTAALSQAETQPVAWRYRNHNWKNGEWSYSDKKHKGFPTEHWIFEPLFASPVPAKREAGEQLKNHDFSSDYYRPSSCLCCVYPRNHPIHSPASTPADGEDYPAPVPHLVPVPALWAECAYCKEVGEEECLHPVAELRWNGEQWCCEECGSGEEPDAWQAAPQIAIPSPQTRVLPTTPSKEGSTDE